MIRYQNKLKAHEKEKTFQNVVLSYELISYKPFFVI
jgi:hypothetical protein